MYDCLRKKIVVVTGASQGIGRAIAEAFAREESMVYNLDVRVPEVSLPGIDYLNCDVSSETDVEKAVKQIVEMSGGIDILVNNAGIEKYNSVGEVSVKEWDEIIGVNLRGSFLMSRHALPYLLKKGNGVIIFVASIQSNMVQKRDAAYVTSKHALLGLAKSLAVDYAPSLRTVALCPGTILTPLQIWCAEQEVGKDPERVRQKLDEWGRMCPMGRQGKPEEVANVAVFMSTVYASYVTGTCIYIDGGFSSFVPESAPKSEAA